MPMVMIVCHVHGCDDNGHLNDDVVDFDDERDADDDDTNASLGGGDYDGGYGFASQYMNFVLPRSVLYVCMPNFIVSPNLTAKNK